MKTRLTRMSGAMSGVTHSWTRNWLWPWWAEAVLVVTAAGVMVSEAGPDGPGGAVLPVAVSLVAGLALPLRHRWPLPVTVLAVAAAGIVGAMLPLLLIVFHLAADHRVRTALAAFGTALAVNSVVRPPLSLWEPRTYGPCALVLVGLALGLWAGSSRRLAAALRTQVEHLKRERELRESAARISERTAIAAEMHDVLAHRLSLIALHTGVLARRADTLPEPVAERVALLRTAATDALADLRDVLGALRTPAEPDRAPALREVDDLLDAARRAGQRVSARVEGDEGDAPAAHRLAVYRLVQEAVTNARKHAPDAEVRVTVHYGPDATRAEVVNALPAAGPAEAPVPSGYGLVGLRERVLALGGELTAGPAGDGTTWRIAARLPVTAGEPPLEPAREPAGGRA